MKVGDLVRPVRHGITEVPIVEDGWIGVIIGYERENPVIFWNNEFPSEVEYSEQIEVISKTHGELMEVN